MAAEGSPRRRNGDVLLLVAVVVVDVVATSPSFQKWSGVPLLAALELGLYVVSRLEAHRRAVVKMLLLNRFRRRRWLYAGANAELLCFAPCARGEYEAVDSSFCSPG